MVWSGPSTAASTDEMAALDMKAVYKKSTLNLKEILKNPGVWDPFILCYVEVSFPPRPCARGACATDGELTFYVTLD